MGAKDEDYGRSLPFYGDRVREMGIKLPKPIGLSLFTHQQEDLMQLGDFKIDGQSAEELILTGAAKRPIPRVLLLCEAIYGCCHFGVLTL
ncbi:hypothetical protein JCM19240_5755 [Vibrio maritimus]|uniref:Uncharacterized protein n=1 Tax=Vibrio maritimus TaxID=990268 RepID=A0A090T0S1_9VIBR|nr:hypothetical protein JCM19240_5755 [Vibrio maritimus]